jgi:hypothetical protein
MDDDPIDAALEKIAEAYDAADDERLKPAPMYPPVEDV